MFNFFQNFEINIKVKRMRGRPKLYTDDEMKLKQKICNKKSAKTYRTKQKIISSNKDKK